MNPKLLIHTKKFVLRPYKESDFNLWQDTFLSLPKSKNKWDKSPRSKALLSKAKFRKILNTQKKNAQADKIYDFIGFEKKTGKIVGFSSLMDINRGVFQNAYLGYGILNPYWGQGYGKEMVLETIKFAEILGIS